jgi:hypothetical protein
MTNASSTEADMSGLLSEFEQRREHERQTALQTLSAACPALVESGIDRVVITYDGCGDSGCIESVTAFAGEDAVDLEQELSKRLNVAAELVLPLGWAYEAGSFGELILQVRDRRLVRKHNWRIEFSEYAEHEWSL